MKPGEPLKISAVSNGFLAMPAKQSGNPSPREDAMVFATLAALCAWMKKHFEDN